MIYRRTRGGLQFADGTIADELHARRTQSIADFANGAKHVARIFAACTVHVVGEVPRRRNPPDTPSKRPAAKLDLETTITAIETAG